MERQNGAGGEAPRRAVPVEGTAITDRPYIIRREHAYTIQLPGVGHRHFRPCRAVPMEHRGMTIVITRCPYVVACRRVDSEKPAPGSLGVRALNHRPTGAVPVQEEGTDARPRWVAEVAHSPYVA